jgi:hypothetical protein
LGYTLYLIPHKRKILKTVKKVGAESGTGTGTGTGADAEAEAKMKVIE